MEMAGSRYEHGRSGEYILSKFLRERGWNTLVSPGSRGPADIVATKDNRIWCIQVKVRSMDNGTLLSRKEGKYLLEYAITCGCTPVVAILRSDVNTVLHVATNMRDRKQPCIIRDVLGNFVCAELENGFILFLFDLRTGKNIEP